MRRFRKKPVVVDAMQWTGKNVDEVVKFALGSIKVLMPCFNAGGIIVTRNTAYIETPEGTMHASPGDWIIRGVKGEFYPCKPDIFDATYEPVDATSVSLQKTVPQKD